MCRARSTASAVPGGPGWAPTTPEPVDRHSFPYLRIRGQLALIGATSARATAPFMANGFFREDQAHRLGAILDTAGKRGLFRVVMIHHPPVRNAVPQHKRLFGIGNFQNMVRRHGAELVLHGHSHLPSLHLHRRHAGQVPVVGVAAAGQAPGGTKPAAQYNLIDIDGEPGRWSVRLTRRGLTGAADAARRDRGASSSIPPRDETVRS